MKIFGIQTKNNVFLAPMAGVTDLPFRRLCHEFGAGLCYTEMVSAKALMYGDKKTKQLLINDSFPVCTQIFGSDPNIMAEASVLAAENGSAAIDINFGCPAPKIVNNGDGSAILKDLDLLGKIVRAVSDKSPVPVSVKIRKGFDEDVSVDAAICAEQNGASCVCVHPRLRGEYYSGKADLDVIGEVKKSVSIPVIGNGDIFTPQDAKNMLEYTGCDAVMVGRGAMGNPFIFTEIDEFLKYGEVRTHFDTKKRIETAILHIKMLTELKGEHIGILEARKHAAWYLKGLRGSAPLKERINRAKTFEEMREILLQASML